MTDQANDQFQTASETQNFLFTDDSALQEWYINSDLNDSGYSMVSNVRLFAGIPQVSIDLAEVKRPMSANDSRLNILLRRRDTNQMEDETQAEHVRETEERLLSLIRSAKPILAARIAQRQPPARQQMCGREIQSSVM